MFELVEDPKRDFVSLVNEARDCLNTLARAGGPEYCHPNLAQKLREITPRFPWNDMDVRKFLSGSECRFYASPFYNPPGKKKNEDFLVLDEVIAIRDYAAAEAAPILEKIKAIGAKLEIPTELVISDNRHILNFGFQTPAAEKLSSNRTFNHVASGVIAQLVDIFTQEGESKQQVNLTVPLSARHAYLLAQNPELKETVRTHIARVLEQYVETLSHNEDLGLPPPK